MHCPACGDPTLVVGVPPELVEYAPEQSHTVAACTHCLRVVPAGESTEMDPAFSRISTHLPDDDAAAIPLVLAVGLLDRLALFRAEITALLEQVEQAGVDPILALERLAADQTLEPHFDLDRRVDQLLQLYD